MIWDSATRPSPSVFAPSDLVGPRAGSSPSERVTVGGRVVVTSSGSILMTDAFESIEVVARAGSPALETHDLVTLDGVLVGTRIEDGSIRSLSKPRSRASGDVLRFRDGGVVRALEDRSRALAAVRAFFERRGFLEVETPSLVPSPGLDLHLDAFAAEGGPPSRFLITSPEYQMKRLLTGGVPRCFQIARCFRRAEIGGHHNPEFSMLEWYRAFEGMDAIVGDTEEVVRTVCRALGSDDVLRVGEARVDLRPPFERITVAEAFHDIAGVREPDMLALAADDEERFFRILVETIEPVIARRTTPVVLHRYPAKMASLARLAPDDARYAQRFEVYAAGLELSNGFVELTDPVEQRDRLLRDQADRRATGKPVYPIDERFLEALEQGFPSAAGNALGFDRLVMLASGRARIADVIAFPEGVL